MLQLLRLTGRHQLPWAKDKAGSADVRSQVSAASVYTPSVLTQGNPWQQQQQQRGTSFKPFFKAPPSAIGPVKGMDKSDQAGQE